MSKDIFKNELLNFLKDIKKNNENKVKEFLIDINNQIVKCKCKLIAECNYVIDRLMDISSGSVNIKNKMENWIIDNTDHFCARTKWLNINVLKTEDELISEENEMLNKLYKYLLHVILSEITINKHFSFNDINDVLNSFDNEDEKKIKDMSNEIYSRLGGISANKKTILLKKSGIISVLKNTEEETEHRSTGLFTDKQKATFKEREGTTRVGAKITYTNVPKSLKNIQKHLNYAQINPEDISTKDEAEIIKLCSDKLIDLGSDKRNIDAIKNLWKNVTNSNKDKKSIRNKIYFIAYAIKLLFPDKTYSSLATSIRTIIGIDATTDPLYNIDNNIVNIDIYNYYNNFLKNVSDTEEYRDIYKRNENNRKIVVDISKIVSLIETNAYITPINTTNLINQHIKDTRSEAILRINRLLAEIASGQKEITSKLALAKEITKLINLRLKYFELNDTLKDICQHCELAVANTGTKIKFILISVDIILALL